MRPDVPVVIVGAGLAGLVTAYELQRVGVPSLVLEENARIGGRVHSVTFADGLVAEAHMEEFWEGSPAWALLDELSLPLELDYAQSSVVLGGTLYACRGDGDRAAYLADVFGPDEGDQAAFVDWNARIGALLTRVEAGDGSLRPLMASDFASYVRSTAGSHRVAEWIRVVVESETAIEWDQISALDGIAEMRPFLDRPGHFGELNAHVVGGNARLVDALVAGLPDGTTLTQQRVISVRDAGRYCEVQTRCADGGTSLVRSERVVVTTPSWALPWIALDAPVDAHARAAMDAARSGRYVKVLVRARAEARELWSDQADGLFTLLTDSPAGCVYAGASDDPDADLVLTLLIHGHHAVPLNGLPPQTITQRAIAELEALTVRDRDGGPTRALLPGIGELVTEARAYDYPHAVAYWPVAEGRSRFDALADALRRPHGRVHFGGDTTESSHSDGAVRSALRTARQVSLALGVHAEAAS
ncbi:MAG TPA: NAD(P)/FAD-dependent oxidoreductase [Nocardioidaceae bacterium]|nr:NAD(P)/FAD-dependent oxidoreductase [Nocardioidaceae bacterium]